MWLVFHFLLTRRTARLVHAAEQLAAGNLAARSRLKGSDELGRLGRAFDAMARRRRTQTRSATTSPSAARRRGAAGLGGELPRDLRCRRGRPSSCTTSRPARSSTSIRRPAPPSATRREEFRRLDIGTLGSGERPYTQRRTRWSCSRVRLPASSCASSGTARSKDGDAALARGVRQAGNDRRPGPHPLARPRHHRSQARRGGAARQRRAVSLDVQRVDRRAGAVERGRRDRRHQSRAVADVRLRRRRDRPRRAPGGWRGPSYPPDFLQRGRGRRIAPPRGHRAAQGRLARWSSNSTACRCNTRASRTC